MIALKTRPQRDPVPDIAAYRAAMLATSAIRAADEQEDDDELDHQDCWRDPICPTVEQALRRHRYTATAFGMDALGDPRLVFDLRIGRELRHRTREKVKAFLRELGEEL